MKKTIVLLALVLLLPLAFAANECVKSDFSSQHFKNLTSRGTGEQVVLGTFFKDECTGVAQLTEYYCFNAFLRSSEEACPAGLYCAAGADGMFKVGPKEMEKIADPKIDDSNLYELRTIDDLLFGVGDNEVMQFNGQKWIGGPLDL